MSGSHDSDISLSSGLVTAVMASQGRSELNAAPHTVAVGKVPDRTLTLLHWLGVVMIRIIIA